MVWCLYDDITKEWMEPSNPSVIGGRDTDFSQIGYSLQGIIKERYPINSVPIELAENLEMLCRVLEGAEEVLKEFIHCTTNYLMKEKKDGQFDSK